MAAHSLVVCGLARDCAKNLDTLIPRIEALGSAFGDYRVIVVENDSEDETGNAVSRWSEENSAVRAIRFSYDQQDADSKISMSGIPGSDGWFGSNRIQRMAYARNQYLEALCSETLPDFVIIIDLDIKSFSRAGIEYSFGRLDEWDILTANGMRFSIRHPFRAAVYWDSYAYEPAAGYPDGVQTAKQIESDQRNVARKLKSGDLLPAKSAFGGLGIYRAQLLANHRYSVMANNDSAVPVLCDHPTLHRSIREQHADMRLVINPHLSVDYGSLPDLLLQFASRYFKQ